MGNSKDDTAGSAKPKATGKIQKVTDSETGEVQWLTEPKKAAEVLSNLPPGSTGAELAPPKDMADLVGWLNANAN